MPTIDVAITAGGDDADEVSTTVVSLTRNVLLNVDNTGEWNAWKFRGITIPAGATIDVAYLTVKMNGASLDEPDVTFDAEDSASPADFAASNGNISGRTPTTATVNWSNTNAGTSDVNTSSIVSIIQELVDSYAPYDNENIVIRMTSRANDSTRDTSIESYETSTSTCARLHIEYTEAGQNPPTVVLDTADDTLFADPTPTLLFTGTDQESNDIRYNIQISDNPDAWAGGIELEDKNDPGGNPSVSLHENGYNALTWEDVYQNDDRFGHSFTGNGGILKKISFYIGSDSADESTDGYAMVRVYSHQGTYGTSGEPLNAVDAEDTPTHGWIAESTHYNFVYADLQPEGWFEFEFTGTNRIRLVDGTYYFAFIDWIPTTGTSMNLLGVGNIASSTHPGNAYCDGPSANNGIRTDLHPAFRVYEEYIFLDKLSGTDSGFANQDNGGDTDPFTSGDQIGYTVQAGDSLADATYYWRVRAIDPTGSNSYGSWTSSRTFDVLVGLTPNDTTHAHSAENVVLTQVHVLAIQDATHSHSADNINFPIDLVIQDASHSHTADNVTLTQAHVLAVQDALHGHTADNLTLTQNHVLSINDALHSHNADNVVLTQIHVLSINDALHGHTAENLTLSVATDLVIQDANHSHSADNITLTQNHILAVNDALHSHSAENISLVVDLVIQDAVHSHTSENVVLTQVHNLVVQDALHAQSADNVSLIVNLVIQDAVHGHTSDNVTLTQVHNLSVQDSLHAHLAESPTLTLLGDLEPQDALHTHTADNVTLTQVHVLQIQDALHSHSADNVVLTQNHVLVINDSLHDHTADNVTLSVVGTLEVNEGLHSHTADNITLTQTHVLVIQDSYHGHTAENVSFSQEYVLVIQDGLHGHIADNVNLVVDLSISDSVHSHTAESPILGYGLLIQDAVHGHSAENITLTQIHYLLINDSILSLMSDMITIGGVSKPGHASLGRGKRGVGVSREKIGTIDISQSHQHTEVH